MNEQKQFLEQNCAKMLLLTIIYVILSIFDIFKLLKAFQALVEDKTEEISVKPRKNHKVHKNLGDFCSEYDTVMQHEQRDTFRSILSPKIFLENFGHFRPLWMTTLKINGQYSSHPEAKIRHFSYRHPCEVARSCRNLPKNFLVII